MSPEETRLKEMDRQLQQKKERVAELRGEKKTMMKQLGDEGCDSIEEAEKEIISEDEKANKLREKLRVGLAELEEKYEWD